ncbi:transcriptional regulator [Vibrio phage pVa-21]|nr:transcriptional regulator [Vibrio phage pVa-21]
MQQYTLTALQSVMVLIMSETNEPMTGYDTAKTITERGYKWSHQQVYRDLAKMPLNLTEVPQEGKPDKKNYTLQSDVEYIHNAKIIPIPVIEEYELLDVAREKWEILNKRLETITLNYERELVKFEIGYLEKLITKLQAKAA